MKDANKSLSLVPENDGANYSLDESPNMVADLTTATLSFCSFKATTAEEKKQLFTAMNNPTARLEEKINVPLTITDIYVETVNFVDEHTGEVQVAPRIVLIDIDGNSYGCCSMGVFSSLKKLIQVFGVPTWEDGVEVIATQVSSRRIKNGKVMTLKLA